MRTVFMGTPEFALMGLKSLLLAGHSVECVVTQPDRPAGRGGKLQPPPVKVFALENGIEVLQPLKASDPALEAKLRAIEPDAIIVIAYGKILRESLLKIPKVGCINVHASLLPKYRGAWPIAAAIMNGETVTGVTTMLMDCGIDTGDILLQRETEIRPDMTFGELHDVLAVMGAELLAETLEKLEDLTLLPTKQDHSLATFTRMISRDDEKIDWSRTAAEISNMIRALNPYPLAFCAHGDTVIKIWRAEPLQIGEAAPAQGPVKQGQVLRAGKQGIEIACGTGVLSVKELQKGSSRRMSAADFLNGYKLEPGTVLA